MIGLEVNGKPLMRAYSIVSSNYEEHMEFYSIKVQDGPLTSRLQHLKVGDTVMISKKPTGTLVQDNLLPGKTSICCPPAPASPRSCPSSRTRTCMSATTK